MPNDIKQTPSDDIRLMARVAWLYYMESLTQQQIGQQLGLSRMKINRLLQQARNQGIVQISVNIPGDDSYFPQEQALCRKFGLRDAVVVPAADPGEPLYLALAQGTADWLTPQLKDDMCIGMGYSRTVSHLPQVFRPTSHVDCVFTEVVGGMSDGNGSFGSYNVTSKMAELVNGRVVYLYAPSIVSTKGACDALLQEASIAKAMERARNCDILLHGIGPVDTSALMYIRKHFDEADLHKLRDLGAVGDALGRYFNVDGQPLDLPINDRIIGLTLEDVRKIPISVIVAGGMEKVPVLRAAIRGKLLNVLITDAATAQALLEEEPNNAN